MKRACFWLLLIGPGCTYVTDAEVERRLAELDDDGDGYSRNGGGDPDLVDCNDADPEINPGAEERWYDGVDQNCDGKNDFDQDGDNYYAAASGETNQIDCNDLDAEINPGAVEIWYDGVNQDCVGDPFSDYDADKDSYFSDSHPNLAGQVGNDCNDQDDTVHVDAVEEDYDGIDQNCDTKNDYDQDEDSYTLEGSPEGSADDCDDEDDTIHVDATEIYYDDIDQNCDDANDWDADGDNYTPPGSPNGNSDDCDDDRADVNPGETEILGDGVDHDCDSESNPDGFLALGVTPGFSGIRALEFSESAEENWVLLSVLADNMNDGQGNAHERAAAALAWSLGDPDITDPAAMEFFAWKTENNSIYQLTSGLSIFMDGSVLYGATGSWRSDGKRFVDLTRFDLADESSATTNKLEVTTSENFSSVALTRDSSNDFHAFGCDDTNDPGVQYLKASEAEILDNDPILSTFENFGPDPSYCQVAITGSTGLLVFADPGNNFAYTRYSFDPTDDNDLNLTFLDDDITASVADIALGELQGSLIEVLADNLGECVSVRHGGSEFCVASTLGSPEKVAFDVDQSNGILYLAWISSGLVEIAWGNLDDALADGGSSMQSGGALYTSEAPEDVALHHLDTGVLLVAAYGSDSLEIGRVNLP